MSSPFVHTNDFPNPLPSDCLYHIVSFLTPNDYKTWDRVCKQWSHCFGETHFKELAKKELKIQSFVPKTSWKKFYLSVPVGKNLIKNGQIETPPEKTTEVYDFTGKKNRIETLPGWKLIKRMR